MSNDLFRLSLDFLVRLNSVFEHPFLQLRFLEIEFSVFLVVGYLFCARQPVKVLNAEPRENRRLLDEENRFRRYQRETLDSVEFLCHCLKFLSHSLRYFRRIRPRRNQSQRTVRVCSDTCP